MPKKEAFLNEKTGIEHNSIHIPLATFTPKVSYPTSHMRVTSLTTSISHRKKGIWEVLGVFQVWSGVAKYVGCGDSVPQHASRGSEKRPVFDTTAGKSLQMLSLDVEVQMTKHYKICFFWTWCFFLMCCFYGL